jgi:hypothetical protein
LRSYKNKLRIFTSYFNQFCGLLDHKEEKKKSKKIVELSNKEN